MIRARRIVMSIAREAARAERRRAAEDRREKKRLAQLAKRQGAEDRRDAKERAQAEKASYYAARELEAIDLSEAVLDEEQDLRNILADTLLIDDTIDFDTLRVSAVAPTLAIPVDLASPAPHPVESEFLDAVQQPAGLARLWPGAQRQRGTAAMEAAARYAEALDTWHLNEARRVAEVRRLKSEHAEALTARAAKRHQRDAEVDAFRDAYRAGDPDAILAYNTMVLERSDYPDGIPKNFSLAYTKATRELVIEFELPTVAIVPGEVEFTYQRNRDAIVGEQRDAGEIASLYADVIAAVALRTLHEVFEADQQGTIAAACFNGFVHAIDPATGHDRHPHLVSVHTTAEAFARIDLARVDKIACLRSLGAALSPAPADAVGIAPIGRFAEADASFVDRTDRDADPAVAHNIPDLAPDAFVDLLERLFAAMGLADIRSHPSGDGSQEFTATDERPLLGGRVAIKVKRNPAPVDIDAVRDLYAAMAREGAPKGILVTASDFAPDAVDFAASRPIELIDGDGLLYMLDEIGQPARIDFPAPEHAA